MNMTFCQIAAASDISLHFAVDDAAKISA